MGIQIQVLREGDGINFPRKGQKVSVNYTGFTADGNVFDSSHDRGQPFSFRLGTGEVLRGFDEGVSLMSLGQIARLTCPPEYAYGAKGLPGFIPPNSALIFEVELKSFL
jgi:FK506-binding protein 1